MPDEPDPNAPPPETPPAEEALDPTGVPWKNRVAEAQRKAEEAEARRQEVAQENERYRQELGRVRTQPQPPAEAARTAKTLDEMEGTFDAPTRQYLQELRKHFETVAKQTAEQTGYGLMTDVSHTTVLQQDAELLEETKRQMALLNNNPLWVNADDRLKRDRAIEGAKAVLNAKRAAKPPAPTTPPPGNLPPTHRGAPQPTPDDKQAFLAEWKAEPENVKMFNMFYRGTDINSPEGQKLYNTVAEEAWNGTIFTGAVATAAKALKIEGAK